MRRWFWGGVLLGAVLPLGVGGGAFWWWQTTDRIAPGVTVHGVPIGGLPAAVAQRALADAFAPDKLPAMLPIVWQGQTVGQARLRDLGIRPDIPRAVRAAWRIGRRASFTESLAEFLRAWRHGAVVPLQWQWDEKRAKGLLLALAASFDRPPQRAWVVLNGSAVQIVPSRPGRRLQVGATLRLWRRRVTSGQLTSLPLVAQAVRPEVTTDDVAAIDGVVGTATTYFRPGERDRSHNIRLAAQRLDHAFIPPGETLSFNALVGPRTPKRGFRVARVLVRGQFTRDFGGGVCQVAGTLYNAALRAGMEVVERHRHSRPVGYLPPGLDATVNFGALDLRLRNPFPTPLYLRTFVKGGRLTVMVLGKRQGAVRYRIVCVTERFGSVPSKVVPDPSLPEGRQKVVDQGSAGYRVTVWRLRLKGGAVVARERISVDTYLPQPRVVRVGTARGQPPRLAPSLAASPPSLSDGRALTAGFPARR